LKSSQDLVSDSCVLYLKLNTGFKLSAKEKQQDLINLLDFSCLKHYPNFLLLALGCDVDAK